MVERRPEAIVSVAAFVFTMIFAGVALAQTGTWATSLERVEPPGLTNPRLTPGDILALIMPGESALTGEFQVDRAGRILLPEIGSVTLAGETLDSGRAALREALGSAYKNVERLRVILKEQRLLVQVGGYVNKPGEVDLPAGANVQNAIAAAGGLAEGAQLDRLHVQRGSERIPFDYKAFLDTGNAELLPGLQPLDIIFVPASPVTGNVFVDFDGRDLAEAGDAADEGSAVRGLVVLMIPPPPRSTLFPIHDALPICAGGVTSRASAWWTCCCARAA